jgi:hypothetical protein
VRALQLGGLTVQIGRALVGLCFGAVDTGQASVGRLRRFLLGDTLPLECLLLALFRPAAALKFAFSLLALFFWTHKRLTSLTLH